MKRRIFSLLMIVAMLSGMFGCAQDSSADPTEITALTVIPTESPVEKQYALAKAEILEAADLAVKITDNKTIFIADESYLLRSNQNLRYTGMGTDSLQVAVTEELLLDGSYDKFEDFYTAGMLYSKIYDENHFCGSVDEDEYLSRLVPAALLDEKLYTDISANPDGKNTLLSFSDPTDAESWVLPEGANFLSASGKALLDASGSLLKTEYVVEYIYGNFKVTREISAEPYSKKVSLAVPAIKNYTQVDHIEALRLYDTAVMFLYAANTATTTLSETIVSQAAECVYATQNTINYYGSGQEHVSKVDYTVSVQQSNQTDSYSQTEVFQNGVYTVFADGGTPKENPEITASNMLDYCQGYLSENIVALNYIEDVSAEEIGNSTYLTLDFTEEYANELCNYASSVLFDDEKFMANLATESSVTDCSGYLTLDKYTGLPTSVGIQYNVNHTIDGVDYPLVLQANQSFYLESQTAYKTVTGESLPEQEPNEMPKPLFYKVTGDNGQQMYLLGTIHVGDDATAYLPQKIYDALSASDALAVEADVVAFQEALASDPVLAAQVMGTCIYTDGTMTKDHLDEKTYTDAVKLLKASGNYNVTTEMMKPSMWQSTLSNFYIQQNYELQSEKGVDMRLLKIAKDQGIEIREIESGQFQMEMFGSYSDELQAFLLEALLEEDPSQYYADTKELYTLWCAGDETALREAVLDDVTDLSEEELLLYEEYHKAMITDRNAAMLTVATDYLESGETVFYAVGLAHLLAGNGLVDTLREAGYNVELINYT